MRGASGDGGGEPSMSESIFARRFHAVVANPPYTVPGHEAGEAYRARYESATGKFGMGLPFTERMFELAVDGGFIGQITSNAFMKREHGRALVEKVLPRFDLTSVVDTSGAYIPGHGTPTVILFARNRPPSTDAVRVVQSRRGEPETPEGAKTPAGGLVKLLKPVLADLDADIKREHPALAAPMRARVAAAWVLTACMAEDFEARTRLYERRAFGDAHLAEMCGAITELFPFARWFDADAGANVAFTAVPSRAASDRLRASIAALPSMAHALRDGCGPLAGKLWPHTDSQWIGDLHQLLDAWAVKELAFCQTPKFVADFILDRTLTPAVREFGLDGLRVLDPACGAGHLLVNAFWRLFDLRADPDDGAPEHVPTACARLALDSLHGGDLNPAVAALTEWRLALAYLDATTPRTLASVPDDLPIHVEVGDALLAERPEGYRPPAWVVAEADAARAAKAQASADKKASRAKKPTTPRPEAPAAPPTPLPLAQPVLPATEPPARAAPRPRPTSPQLALFG